MVCPLTEAPENEAAEGMVKQRRGEIDLFLHTGGFYDHAVCLSLIAFEPVGRKFTSISSVKISVGKEGETHVH